MIDERRLALGVKDAVLDAKSPMWWEDGELRKCFSKAVLRVVSDLRRVTVPSAWFEFGIEEGLGLWYRLLADNVACSAWTLVAAETSEENFRHDHGRRHSTVMA